MSERGEGSVFSAPGKLVISGEYAVLDGHPALVAAVDRRAVCRFEPGDDLIVSAFGGPLSGKTSLPVVIQGPRVVVEGGEGRYGLFEAMLGEALARGLPLPRGHVSVDTSAFFLEGEKLGLGSSAAVAVALSSLVLAGQRMTGQRPSGPSSQSSGGLDRERVRRLATAVHDRFSGHARGSGIDVAASSHGSVLRFQSQPASKGGRGVELSSWSLCPRGLRVLVPFAGVAASTRTFLDGLRRLQDRDARAYTRALEDVGYASLELLGAVAPDEDPRVFLAAVDRCRRSLQRLGDKASLDIVSAPHLEIARIARAHSGAAKPSGAGGGDVAVCFVPDEEASACRAALEDAGYPVVDVDIPAGGALRE